MMRMPPGLNAFCTPCATCWVVLISSASTAGSTSKKLRARAFGITSVCPSDCGIASMNAIARASSKTLNAGISPRMIFAKILLSSYMSDPRFGECVHDLADRVAERRVVGFEPDRQCVELFDQGTMLAGRGRLAEQPRDVAEQLDQPPAHLGVIDAARADQLGVQGRELVLQFCLHGCLHLRKRGQPFYVRTTVVCGQSFSGLPTGCVPSGCPEPPSDPAFFLRDRRTSYCSSSCVRPASSSRVMPRIVDGVRIPKPESAMTMRSMP